MSAKRGAKRHTERRLIELALAPLAARAWRRGVIGGERTWLGIGLVVLVLRQVRRQREDEVVFTEALPRGQGLLISHGPPPPTRRARRKARRKAGRLTQAEAHTPLAPLPEPG